MPSLYSRRKKRYADNSIRFSTGDGICCDHGEGHYSAAFDGETILNGTDIGLDGVSASFGSCSNAGNTVESPNDATESEIPSDAPSLVPSSTPTGSPITIGAYNLPTPTLAQPATDIFDWAEHSEIPSDAPSLTPSTSWSESTTMPTIKKYIRSSTPPTSVTANDLLASRSQWETIFVDGFERGFGNNFYDAGEKSFITGERKYNGKKSLCINDDHGTSRSFSRPFIVDDYASLRLKFKYNSKGLEQMEGFVVEVAIDGDAWELAKAFRKGSEWTMNGEWMTGIISIDATDIEKIQVQFRGISNHPDDKIFIDNVIMQGMRNVY